MDALTGYRSADPYPRQSRDQTEAYNEAADLRTPVAGLNIQITALEALLTHVSSDPADEGF